MKKDLKVWLLSDNVPGHVSQSRGLLRLLAKVYSIESFEIEVKLQIKFFSRLFLSFLLNYCQSSWPARLAIFLHKTTRLPSNIPDVIISMGGNTSFLNIALSRIYRCKNIFIGSLRHLDASGFDAVLTLEDIGTKNNIVMDIAPAMISPEEATLAAERYKKENQLENAELWTMIIGGDGAGFEYRLEDWEHLTEGMRTLAERYGIRWLISTSRRTGLKNEEQIKRLLPEVILADAVWYNHLSKKVMLPFLGAGNRVFVTADSMSMIAETIHAGKTAQILFPQTTNPGRRYRDALRRFESRAFASRVDLIKLGQYEASDGNHTVDIEKIQRGFLDKLLTVLNNDHPLVAG